ncbi:hypothetical protein Bca52824_051331 [Brassica carinata]|uniref:Uncharacterized protein n=1 Tax=Brassica carinata TaxID=52824 RepID=A0A8X7UJQ6_BRACI|nr:hypothetical protein Bca52824_051331 [Brassica carinata]
MWCAYSTRKLLFLTILLLVEASLGRYIPCRNANFKIPDGYVRIRWDIMNETRGSYSANWPLNSNLPPRREKVVPKCCEDDVIKSSSSFQITVGRVGIEYYPPEFVGFTTPRSKLMCFPMMQFTKTRGYLKTWTAMCGLFLEFLKTDNEEDQ